MRRLVNLVVAFLLLPGLAHCNSENDREEIAKSDFDRIEAILGDISSWRDETACASSRPFVTLTFAQTLDGKVGVSTASASSSSNLPLSCDLSFLLTHGLRSIHDAILVGGNTLTIDNPRLSNRLWAGRNDGEESNHFAQPRPVVLDTNLRHVLALRSKLRVARRLIVCCSEEAMARHMPELGKHDKLELLPCRVGNQGRLDVKHVLEQLYEKCGIRSLMVEGGSAVITSFILARACDALCITIAPKLVVSGGLAAIFPSDSAKSRESSWIDWSLQTKSSCFAFVPLGSDCIFRAKMRHATSLS